MTLLAGKPKETKEDLAGWGKFRPFLVDKVGYRTYGALGWSKWLGRAAGLLARVLQLS